MTNKSTNQQEQDEQAKITKAIDEIGESIEEAYSIAVESLHFAYIVPAETDQLTDALTEALEALKTAYNIAEELKHPRHQDER